MEFDREKLKQIWNLMILAAVLILIIKYSKEIIYAAEMLLDIIKPFIYGCIVAFILNIPMRFFEKTLFQNWNGKYAGKFKRPVSILMSVLMILLLILLTVWLVIPQLASSVTEIGRKLPAFMERVHMETQHLAEHNQILSEHIGELHMEEINWDSVIDNITDFMKNGAGDILSSTFTMVGSIISGVVHAIIAVVFAIYILAQKEQLADQTQRVLRAYIPQRIVEQIQKVCSLLYTNFNNFITGQCLDAVILGCMFVVSMTILRLPYALVIGFVITLTALVPIAGAYIGWAIGIFLILIENPFQAVIFWILFFILQQIEGKFIYPKVVGKFVSLPGIWVLFAITVGGSLFGIIGMLVFIPLTATAYALLRESVNRRNAEKEKKIEEEKAKE